MSFSNKFDDNCGFERTKQSGLRDSNPPGYEPPPVKRVKLDLMALWNDGLFTEDSFADLSTHASFEAYFKSVRDELTDLQNTNTAFSVSEIRAASNGLSEILLGPRGDWWVPYAVLVDPLGKLAECQTLVRGDRTIVDADVRRELRRCG